MSSNEVPHGSFLYNTLALSYACLPKSLSWHLLVGALHRLQNCGVGCLDGETTGCSLVVLSSFFSFFFSLFPFDSPFLFLSFFVFVCLLFFTSNGLVKMIKSSSSSSSMSSLWKSGLGFDDSEVDVDVDFNVDSGIGLENRLSSLDEDFDNFDDFEGFEVSVDVDFNVDSGGIGLENRLSSLDTVGVV